ncbi:MAG: GH25 family lysozyme [Rubricoccaceae bacterium]|nr:GH25 family lysozyme [Rubricoccaceae bacterium]
MPRLSFRLAAFVVVTLMGWIVLTEAGFLAIGRPAHLRYSVRGLDVSHHQAEIDWAAVGQENLDFVFIKATEGADWVDTRFEENWDGAQRAGLARGAYHFFRFCGSGVEQAEHFLATVPNEPNLLPPAVDVEYTGNCGRNRSAEDIREELALFLDTVRNALGVRPVIYADSDAYRRIIAGHFPRHPLWIPELSDEPRLAGGRRWTFWQHDHRGEIEGIRGHADLNVFSGSRQTFRRLVF